MFHPGAASIDCAECQKWAFNIETGEKQTYKSGPDRELLPIALAPGVSPPCHKCPKCSPEQAKVIEFTEKNATAFAHYRQAKAVGLTDAERRDPIVRRNFALLDQLTAERDRRDNALGLAEALVAVLTKK